MQTGKKNSKKQKPKKEGKYDISLSVDASMDELLMAGLFYNPKEEKVKMLPDKNKIK